MVTAMFVVAICILLLSVLAFCFSNKNNSSAADVIAWIALSFTGALCVLAIVNFGIMI